MDKRQFQGNFSELRKIINSWNLFPGTPNDEYDFLNHKILNQLYENAERDKILRILESDLVVNYGLYSEEFDGEKFADKIIDWWNKKNNND